MRGGQRGGERKRERGRDTATKGEKESKTKAVHRFTYLLPRYIDGSTLNFSLLLGHF